MPSREDEDRKAKAKAREERRKTSGVAPSRDSSDRRAKDRARSGRDRGQPVAPGAVTSTERAVRSKKSSGSTKASSGAIDRSDRSGGHSSRSGGRSRPSSGKSRTSKPATAPGAVTSSSSDAHSRRERRKAGMESANTSIESKQDAGVLDEEKGQTEGGELLIAAIAIDEAKGKSPVDLAPEISMTSGVNQPLSAPLEPIDHSDPNASNDEDGKSEVAAATPFYCKAWFWIAVLLILVGGAVAIFFLLKQDSIKASQSDPVGTTKDPPLEVPTMPPVSNRPSLTPSSAPSKAVPSVILPKPEDCSAIANGEDISGQSDATLQSFQVQIDVVLLSQSPDESTAQELEAKIQAILMPEIAGCPTNMGQTNPSSQVARIVNGQVTVRPEPSIPCVNDTNDTPCMHASTILDLYLLEPASVFTLTNMIIQVFGAESGLVSKLGLEQPFKALYIVSLDSSVSDPSSNPTPTPSATPSSAPSVIASSSPTRAPVTVPTTEVPTVAPSFSPSMVPSSFLSSQPTRLPTLPPTPGPTPVPTPGPTPVPTTLPPTAQPTMLPSSRPTLSPQPSSSPTKPCISSNAGLTSTVNSWFSSKAAVEAQYGPIGDWCFTPGVTSMKDLFFNKKTFNEDISNWDVSTVTDMTQMFYQANAFNQDLSSWDTSLVTSMKLMFRDNSGFNGDMSTWDVSSVGDFSYMFYQATSFNRDLSSWDTSSATNMEYQFFGALAFNQDISGWDVSSVAATNSMFSRASSFNQDLSQWDVSSAILMHAMFAASAFNGNISSWDVSSATSIYAMFNDATFFNQDLSSWDVSRVSNFFTMFEDASSFNQNLCAWGPRLKSNAVIGNIFDGTSCPQPTNPNLSSNPRGPFCHVCLP